MTTKRPGKQINQKRVGGIALLVMILFFGIMTTIIVNSIGKALGVW